MGWFAALVRERALLVECLLAAAEPRHNVRMLAAEVEGVTLLELARSFAVAETVAHALLAAGALDELRPAHAADALRSDLENASAKNHLLVSEAASIQAALRSAGIESVVLKGVALVADRYRSPGARHVGDLDLLVDPARIGDAAAVLRAAGCVTPLQPVGYDGRPENGLGRHHLPPYRTPAGLSCELHFRLPGRRGGSAAVSGVLARSREAPWRTATVRVPSFEDLLGIACVHALGAHGHDGRFAPRHLADVAVLAAAGADFAEAARLHPGPEVAESRVLLDRARAGDATPLWRRAASRPHLVARRAASAVTALADAARLGKLGLTFFPSRAFMASRYGIPGSAWWLPALYLWRPLRAVLRVLTGR